MRGIGITLLLSCLPVAFVYAENTRESVKRAFIQARIVPDVLASFDPKFVLDVTYTIPETGQQKAVTPPGRNFTMPQTLNRPTWSIPSNDKHLAKENFVIAMLDPDAPTPQHPTVAQVRHFLGGNFRLDRSLSAIHGAGTPLVNNTPALSDYLQPSPPNISDPHRYVWLLYRQPLDFPTSVSPNITNFNISAFAEQFGLGKPLAGNFMTVSTNPADLAAAGES